MEKLTERQNAVLEEIKKFIAKKGYAPTVRELCQKVNLNSTATVQMHLTKLQEKGYIRKDSEKNRTIELLVPNEYSDKNDGIVSVPLLGKITAGSPIEAIEMPDEYFPLPVDLVSSKKEVFTLKVDGESMINKGIFDGDYVIVRKQNNAKNGDTVVAMTDENEVTLKTFYKEDNYFRLQPENDFMTPIILKNVTILGKAIGLYRKF